MTRRQSSNQWSGGIAAHPTPKKFRVQKSGGKFRASIFWDQDGILFIDYVPKGQTINAEYYSSLLVQIKDILKEKRHGKFTKLFLHENAPGHRALATEKKLAYLCIQRLDPPLVTGSGPVGLPPVLWTEKTIERSPFFVRRGGHCCRGDPVGRTSL
jgi:hypothetical protein